MSIRRVLLDLRTIYGSFEKIAEARGVDRDYLYRLFNGQRTNPTPEFLEKLGVRVSYAIDHSAHEEKHR